MFDTGEFEAVSARLHNYRNQMVAVSKALEALRTLADALVEEMARDAAVVSACAMTVKAGDLHSPVAQADLATSSDAVQPTAELVSDATQEEIAAVVSLSCSADDDQFNGYEIAGTLDDAPITPTTTDEIELNASEAMLDTGGEVATALAPTLPVVPAATIEIVPPQDVAAKSEGKVVEIASRRRQSIAAAPFHRRAVGIAACLLLAGSVTVGMHTFAQTDVAQRLLELGTCDAEVVAANRDCAFLAWMLL